MARRRTRQRGGSCGSDHVLSGGRRRKKTRRRRGGWGTADGQPCTRRRVGTACKFGSHCVDDVCVKKAPMIERVGNMRASTARNLGTAWSAIKSPFKGGRKRRRKSRRRKRSRGRKRRTKKRRRRKR